MRGVARCPARLGFAQYHQPSVSNVGKVRDDQDVLQVLHASQNQYLYTATIAGIDDIAELVRNSHLETLASANNLFDFWFTPSTRPAHQRINRFATEILLANTCFTAGNVRVLRGSIVVASHDHDGHLTGLTRAQIAHVARPSSASAAAEPFRSDTSAKNANAFSAHTGTTLRRGCPSAALPQDGRGAAASGQQWTHGFS